jgi:hypothetical protein
VNSSDRYVNHSGAPDVPTKIKNTSKKRGVEHKEVGFTGSCFSAQASLHQMFSPGCILAWVNPVWDALISLCQTTPSPEEHVVGYYDSGDRMKYWGKLGRLLGWYLGDFVGSRCLRHSRYRAVISNRSVGGLDYRRT